MVESRKVELFTDGACKRNPGPGGWGVLLRAEGGKQYEFYGGEVHTTNNRMELMAVIQGLEILKFMAVIQELETLKQPMRVQITTDSRVVQRQETLEFRAVIQGLKPLRRPMRVQIATDSQYVHQGITQWMPRWKKNGWRTADRKPVKNQDLWKRLDQLVSYHASHHRVDWRWVRGHAGYAENERADQLANRGIPTA